MISRARSSASEAAWLARAVESGVEIVAGTPTIVLALFGYLIFGYGLFGFLSVRERIEVRV